MEVPVSKRVLDAHQEATQLLRAPIGHALHSTPTEGANVLGVGIQEQTMAGHGTGEACVAVYVTDPGRLDEAVPPKIQDVPTELVQRNPIVGFGPTGRHRPAPIGVSFGPLPGPIGTLGFVGHRNGTKCVVGCNHVLARENEGRRGEAILQPGAGDDKGCAADELATLSDWIDLDFEGGPNRVDAAVAEFDHPNITSWIYGLGQMGASPVTPRLGMKVCKSGRSTEIRFGTVTAVRIRWERYQLKRGSVRIVDHLEVTGTNGRVFSWLGDSGALVVEAQTLKPVGMVVGGNDQVTFATPIDRVLDELGVSF
ncbi:hypothetical protein ACWD0A_01830 [Streptomyces sp. NPDC002867]